MRYPVKLYTLSTCLHCKKVKQFMRDYNIDYQETDMDLLSGEERRSAINALRELNPRLTFPTIIIGNRIVVGFKRDEIMEALGI
ncbi:MAG: glutaredoxin family protein [Deltaproteobacteria bacterium]|nr:glutaredoxin family protein [Deltaproteobacteria bacterium]